MRVHLLPAALEREEDWPELDRIIQTFLAGRHRWVIDDPNQIRASRWFKMWLGSARQRSISVLMEGAGPLDPPRRRRDRLLHVGAPLHFRSELEWTAPTKLAAQHLDAPLRILLENARSDGGLVKCVLKAIGEDRKVGLRQLLGDDEWSALWRRWREDIGDEVFFRYEHGGGTTTPPRMRAHHPPVPALPPNLLTVVDSDRRSAGDDLRADSIASQCQRVQGELAGRYYPEFTAALKVWTKRSAENYIPESLLEQRSRPSYLKYLDQRTSDPAHADYGMLKELFGKDLCEVFHSETAEPELHRKALRQRAGDDELDRLVLQVMELL